MNKYEICLAWKWRMSVFEDGNLLKQNDLNTESLSQTKFIVLQIHAFHKEIQKTFFEQKQCSKPIETSVHRLIN